MRHRKSLALFFARNTILRTKETNKNNFLKNEKSLLAITDRFGVL
jgi:hypothetical protein